MMPVLFHGLLLSHICSDNRVSAAMMDGLKMPPRVEERGEDVDFDDY